MSLRQSMSRRTFIASAITALTGITTANAAAKGIDRDVDETLKDYTDGSYIGYREGNKPSSMGVRLSKHGKIVGIRFSMMDSCRLRDK